MVEVARSRYLYEINKLFQYDSEWRTWSEIWNVVEITEHYFRQHLEFYASILIVIKCWKMKL